MTRSALILAIAIGIVGCQPGQTPWGAADAGGEVDNRPPADVQLPPVPNLDLVDVPTQYDDGSYSVSGVLLNSEELRDSGISVTGILQTIYECELPGDEAVEPEPEPSDDRPERFEVRPGCLRPHVYIADSLRSSQRLLVTGYDVLLYESQLRAGTKYTFEGIYRQQTRGFISTEDGLLVARTIEGEGIVLPTEDADAAP